MRALPSEITNYLTNNSGLRIRQLLWIEATHRGTGVKEPVGFWSGEDHTNFVIDGAARTYFGTGQFVNFGKLTSESTLNVRRLTSTVTALSEEVEAIIYQYRTRMAPAEVHLAFFSPETNNLVSPPLRVFKGWVDKFPIKRGKTGDATGTLELVGYSRLLTLKLAQKRSHETQQRRQQGDTLYLDVSLTGQVKTPWGSQQA